MAPVRIASTERPVPSIAWTACSYATSAGVFAITSDSLMPAIDVGRQVVLA